MEDQFGVLTVRLSVYQPTDRVKWVTLHKVHVTRAACEGELEELFSRNRHLDRRECSMEWVYTDIL